MAFRKISLERMSNNLACALQLFLCLFCARFALLKTGLSKRKKILKWSHFCKKRKIFCVFFFETPSKVTNFNTSPTPPPPPPPFENFSLDTLNSEEKPSVKNRSTCRSTGDDFEIYRSGRKNPDRFHLWSRQFSSISEDSMSNKILRTTETNLAETLTFSCNKNSGPSNHSFYPFISN